MGGVSFSLGGWGGGGAFLLGVPAVRQKIAKGFEGRENSRKKGAIHLQFLKKKIINFDFQKRGAGKSARLGKAAVSRRGVVALKTAQLKRREETTDHFS